MEYYTDFLGGPIIYLPQNTWVWHLEGGSMYLICNCHSFIWVNLLKSHQTRSKYLNPLFLNPAPGLIQMYNAVSDILFASDYKKQRSFLTSPFRLFGEFFDTFRT